MNTRLVDAGEGEWPNGDPDAPRETAHSAVIPALFPAPPGRGAALEAAVPREDLLVPEQLWLGEAAGNDSARGETALGLGSDSRLAARHGLDGWGSPATTDSAAPGGVNGIDRGFGLPESVAPAGAAGASLDLPAFAAEADEAGTPAQRGRLLRLCEPVFHLVCRLNRIKRLGTRSDRFSPHHISAEFRRVLDGVAVAARELGLSGAVEPLTGPLRCFVDVVMTRGGFGFEESWPGLAPRWAKPDRVLTAAAADALREGNAPAVERFEVLYACLCLTADLLRPVGGLPTLEHLLDLSSRRLGRPPGDRICPGAYDGVFSFTILPPIGPRLRAILVTSCSLLLLAAAGAVVLNVWYARQLDDSIEAVRGALPPAGPPAGDAR